jgi:hypothetical protein
VLAREVPLRPVTAEERADALRALGMPEWEVEGLLELDEQYRAGAGVAPDVEALLGRPATPFRRFAEDHRDAFAADR